MRVCPGELLNQSGQLEPYSRNLNKTGQEKMGAYAR